jgi:hypothetical protein
MKINLIKQFSAIILLLTLVSCNRKSVNDKINKVGDATGEAVGSFAKGLGNGATKAFDVNIDLQNSIYEKGITIGKCTVNSDTTGTDNLLSAYFIFSKDYEGSITSKIFDNKNKEMGRVSTAVKGKKGEAKFIDFHFDKRTNIDSDNKITLE